MAGISIALEADGPNRASALDALFARCAPSGGAPRILVRFAAEPPPVPDAAPDWSFSDVELWFTDHGAVARHDSGIVARRCGADILVGGPDDGAALARAFRRSAQHVLADAMVDHDRFALHAAAVERDGRAMIIIGDTGAGKSTLAVSAARLSWSVLTDDIVWLRLDGDEVLVSGFPKPVHVPPELLAHAPDAATTLPGDERGRLVLPDAVTAADRSAPLLGVVVVDHGDEHGALEPCSSGPPLLTLLMRSFPLQDSPAAVRRFFPLAVQASLHPAAVLSLPADPQRRLTRAGELLAEAWERLESAQ